MFWNWELPNSKQDLNKKPIEIELKSVSELSDALNNWELMRIGLEVFDSKDDFLWWLNSGCPALWFEKPIDLIADGRINDVINIIGRIEYWVYS